MFTAKNFNDEVMVFTHKYGQPPTTAHLSVQQHFDLRNEARMKHGLQPEYRKSPRIADINGIKIRVCRGYDGPHFSGVID